MIVIATTVAATFMNSLYEIMLQTKQSLMVMMRKYRSREHNQADDQQKPGYICSLLHYESVVPTTMIR